MALALLLAAPIGAPAAVLVPATAIADPVASAIRALGEADTERLLNDREYSRSLLRHVQVLRGSKLYVDEMVFAVDLMEAMALIGTGEEVKALDALLGLAKREPAEPHAHSMAMLLAGFHRPAITPQIATFADQSLRSTEAREEFRSGFAKDSIWSAWRGLKDDPGGRTRLAEALLNFGFPGEEELATRDTLQLAIVDARLARGEVAGAAGMAERITTPGTLLKLVSEQRYSRLPGFAAPQAWMARALAKHERATAAALAAGPAMPESILQRAQHLRGLGREAEALALLQPHIRDLEVIAKQGEPGFWLVNEAAYSLMAQGRAAEAETLMRNLLALGYDEHGYLINMAINLGNIMVLGGRLREGADYSVRLFNERKDLANEYGHMWMWSAAACGYALAGEDGKAAEWLQRLRTKRAANRAAAIRALLCADDLPGAGAIMAEGLADRESGLLSDAQDYQLSAYPAGPPKLLDARYRAMLERQDVRAAIGKHGRILKLPLSRQKFGPI